MAQSTTMRQSSASRKPKRRRRSKTKRPLKASHHDLRPKRATEVEVEPYLALPFLRWGCLYDVRLRNRLVFHDDDGRGLGLDDHL